MNEIINISHLYKQAILIYTRDPNVSNKLTSKIIQYYIEVKKGFGKHFVNLSAQIRTFLLGWSILTSLSSLVIVLGYVFSNIVCIIRAWGPYQGMGSVLEELMQMQVPNGLAILKLPSLQSSQLFRAFCFGVHWPKL